MYHYFYNEVSYLIVHIFFYEITKNCDIRCNVWMKAVSTNKVTPAYYSSKIWGIVRVVTGNGTTFRTA